MDHRSFLLLEGGDESDNETIAKLYNHLKSIDANVLKELRLDIYKIQLMLDIMIKDLPSKVIDPNKRKEVVMELQGDYENLYMTVMNSYFKLLERFTDESEELFPNTDDNNDQDDNNGITV